MTEVIFRKHDNVMTKFSLNISCKNKYFSREKATSVFARFPRQYFSKWQQKESTNWSFSYSQESPLAS